MNHLNSSNQTGQALPKKMPKPRVPKDIKALELVIQSFERRRDTVDNFESKMQRLKSMIKQKQALA